MGCYLCVYQAQGPGSDPLGTCWKCSVWACAMHGTRFGRFECGICTPAEATLQALTAEVALPGGNGSSAAIAFRAGERARDDQRQRMAKALNRVVADQERRVHGQTLLPPGEWDIVMNLDQVMRAQGASEIVPARQTGAGFVTAGELPVGGQPGVSIHAVAASVRDALVDRQLRIVDGSVTTVTGALLLAASVAHEPSGEIPPPWEMRCPVLLDPLMWMIATAYNSS